jgi:hypothetical protein
VEFSRHLMTHLDALTEALDGNGDDLATILTVLVDDLTVDISSFAGLSITVPVGGQPITITAMHTHTAATSMMLPLTADTDGGHIVFYAHSPGVFIDLAADARTMLVPHGGDIKMDAHLPPPTAVAAQSGLAVLADRAVIDQAIGFLMEHGYPPEFARTELRRRAAAAGASVASAAQQILQSGHSPDPDPDAVPEGASRDERTG